jgi:hypothetical protein
MIYIYIYDKYCSVMIVLFDNEFVLDVFEVFLKE